ncbi:MAG: hypothetical protein WC851_03135 [Candidatus Shapirobacteria bacterium]|jgi:hypothetical protein
MSSYFIDALDFRLRAMKASASELGLGYEAKPWEVQPPAKKSIFTRVTLTGLPDEGEAQIAVLNQFYSRVDSKGFGLIF